jgi:LytR cell envelope-related transcriptional attenuator
MASEPPPSAPDAPNGGGAPLGLAPFRALLVIAIFVVATITLVSVGTRPAPGNSAFATAPTTTTTIAGPGHVGSTTTTVPRSTVSVVVANATNANGLAAHYSTQLGGQGWSMKTPIDAATTVAASAVYYAAGQQAAAEAIATELGLQASAVQPLTTAVPVAGISGDDVIVVVGADLVTQAGT